MASLLSAASRHWSKITDQGSVHGVIPKPFEAPIRAQHESSYIVDQLSLIKGVNQVNGVWQCPYPTAL